MKSFLLASLAILVLLAAGGYYLYRSIMPDLVAEAVISDSLPEYVPKRLHTRVEAIRKPINKGTEALIEKMHDSEIPLEQVLEAVDNITEDQAYNFLDEVNAANPSSPDDVFDIAKKHFSTDFDPEVFRKPFKEHFEMKQIRNAIAYANLNRKSNDVDISTAKAILKKIIIEKEKELASAGTKAAGRTK